jgi:8-oxo-dGTP pyrophosphatase MutT (NUDIX family)
VTALVRAAGGVVVRDGPGGREVLLVHRPGYGDWTLPKGKCDPGEPDEDCALREVEEETGLACELLDELGSTEYRDSKGRPKRVRYWAMRVVGGVPRPAPPEVDEVVWLPLAEAGKVVTYERDAALLERDAALLERHAASD